ncbi:hypothetical protein P4B35_12570 [Pontiellaceae bacterium B12227]|nr:hypothetical protein [Pontiellaceae bacterium B12227]
MRRNNRTQLGTVLALIAVGVASVGAAQVKSSFESGDFSGWNAQGKGWTVYSRAASDGEKSAMCSVSKGEPAGLKACAKLISKAEPGWVVKVDLDIAGKAKSQSSKAKVSVICIDAAGNILQEKEKVLSAPSTKFQKLSIPEVIVPSGTAETYLMLMVEVKKPAAKAAEWWRFDNVVIDVK